MSRAQPVGMTLSTTDEDQRIASSKVTTLRLAWGASGKQLASPDYTKCNAGTEGWGAVDDKDV
jgi:hypothetical protein